jgi:acetylornithine/N-succinyldiaminopimelate aminotransferase
MQRGFMMETKTNNIINKAEENLIHTYNRADLVLDHGDGVYLYDVEGNKYLDFAAGIAVYALGYNYKDYNEALKAQIDKVVHISNLYYSEPLAEAAQKLVRATGLSKAFFANSGTEAIEGALKLAKKYAYLRDNSTDHEIIAMEHSFHGRSMGALSVTGNAHYREAFGPLIPGIRFAEYNNLESVKALVNKKTCAIICETVQGEGGIFPADKEFLEGLRKLCDENDMLLILDEIQCGMGRTGSMFAYQQYGVMPDVVTSAKALGCGIPVGAFVAGSKCDKVLVPGDHGTTYGGNPLATAAASKVFDLFAENDIIGHVNEVAPYLMERLKDFAGRHSSVKAVRGLGLMCGMQFKDELPVGNVVRAAREHGLIVISAGLNTLRFVPPLIITKQNVDEMIDILEKCV